MAAAVMAIRNRKRREADEEAVRAAGLTPGAAPAATRASRPGRSKKPPGPNAPQAELIAYLDQDGDGEVSQEEIDAYMLTQDGGVWWLPCRHAVAKFYTSRSVQIGVACVILVNFFAIIIEKEVDPYPPAYQRHRAVWLAIDDVCNVIFFIELMVNIYGNFYWPFVTNGWNLLDTLVVIVGTTSLARMELGPLAQVKVLRAFRVLRLFKRVKSLNKILLGLIKSIPGVMNAFMVMLIFMTIYSIVAVDLFRDFGHDGGYTTLQRYGEADGQFGPECGVDAMECINGSKLGGTFETSTNIPALTGRGFYYGQEYFGSFSRALYTLFQVLTGESWSEAVVRPLLFGFEPRNAFLVGIFFTSYILLTQVVLQNVIVAVLLDQFVADPEAEERKEKEEAAKREAEIQALQTAIGAASATAEPSAPLSPPAQCPEPSAAAAMHYSSPSGKGPPWTVDDNFISQGETLRKLAAEQEAMKRQLDEILRLLKNQAVQALEA